MPSGVGPLNWLYGHAYLDQLFSWHCLILQRDFDITSSKKPGFSLAQMISALKSCLSDQYWPVKLKTWFLKATSRCSTKEQRLSLAQLILERNGTDVLFKKTPALV